MIAVPLTSEHVLNGRVQTAAASLEQKPGMLGRGSNIAEDLLLARANDEHPRVRLEALVAASFFEGPGAVRAALEVLRHPTDKFIDYALGVRFQEDFPDKMFVYPVNRNASTPDFFVWADQPASPADIGAAEIGEKREAWLQAWTEVVLR